MLLGKELTRQMNIRMEGSILSMEKLKNDIKKKENKENNEEEKRKEDSEKES